MYIHIKTLTIYTNYAYYVYHAYYTKYTKYTIRAVKTERKRKYTMNRLLWAFLFLLPIAYLVHSAIGAVRAFSAG